MKKNKKLLPLVMATAALTAGAVAYAESVASVVVNRNSSLLNFFMKRRMPDDELFLQSRKSGEDLHNIKMQRMEITSRDGLRLVAHWWPAENPKRTNIMAHGWHGSWYNDFGSSSQLFHDLGCNQLFIEQRSHGESEGKYISYGILERYDVLDWLDAIRPYSEGLPIYFSGISMGAATVLMASEFLKPGEIAGITADCGYTSPEAIVRRCLSSTTKFDPRITIKILNHLCQKRGGFKLSDCSASEAVKRNHIPTVFFHGENDGFVPVEMTLENYRNCASEKEIYLFPNADHGMSYLVDTERYVEAVKNFFEKHDHTIST